MLFIPSDDEGDADGVAGTSEAGMREDEAGRSEGDNESESGDRKKRRGAVQKASPLARFKEDSSYAYGIIFNFLYNDDEALKYLYSVISDVKEVKNIIEARKKLVCLQNGKGRTVLHVAAFRGYADVVDVLIKEDDGVISIQDNENRTALHYALYAKDVNIDIVKKLIENGADVDAKEVGGKTALHLAAARGH